MAGIYRSLQVTLSAFLLASTLYLYAFTADWWIYGWLSSTAGIVNLLDRPNCGWWRLAASTIIVLGTVESFFLVWSIHSVEAAPLLTVDKLSPQRDLLPEGRNILLATLATCLTVSARLRSSVTNIASSQGNIVFEALRSLILLALGAILAAPIGYSALFYVPALSDLVTHTIA